MAPASQQGIRFDQLKSRYSIKVADDPETPSPIAILGRNNLAADAAVLLVVKLDQTAASPWDVFLGVDRRDRYSLKHGESIPLFIALRPDGPVPAAGNAEVRFRLQVATNERTLEIPCTVDARFVTRNLDPPEIKVSLERDIAFGIDHGSAPAAIIIAVLTPIPVQSIATYDGPAADLVLQTAAALVSRGGARVEPLPMRVGTRPIGRISPDEVSWSQRNSKEGHHAPDDPVTPSRRAIPYPFDQEPIEIVLGITVRDAIEIARRVGDEGEFAAELDLSISLALVVEDKVEALLRERQRLPVSFSLASLITVSSRDLDPVVLALGRSRHAAPVLACNPIRRRVNVRSDSVNRTSSLEAGYPLTIEVFADTRDPRLNVEFTFDYEGRKFEFPSFAVTGHELRHGEPISMPLREIIETAIFRSAEMRSHVPQRGRLNVWFRFFEFEHSPDPLFACLSIPIEIEMIPPDVLACIDLGTSATSIWFGNVEGAGGGAVLPLGDTVHQISGDEHEEFEPGLGLENVLLPSMIGLSSDRNMRARLDPLSLGDVALSVGGILGAERRLKLLGRHYDISVPFVPRQDIPANRDTIVFHPKRSLIATRSRPPGVHAFELRNGSLRPIGQVDIRSLIVDVFDELGGYLVPRAISHFERLASTWHGRHSRTLTDTWLEAKQPIGTIVTHPSGVGAHGRETYMEAGRQFLARFAGQLTAPGTVPQPSELWVKLVPEAIAAVNYGIGHLWDQGLLSPGKHLLAALDIGAGTYDASLVEAEIGSEGLENWTVLSHFGLTIGGLDLDRALVDKVASVLRAAFRDQQVANLLTLELDPPAGAVDSATQRFAREIAFQDEIQRAKKQLTAALFNMPKSTAYAWAAGSDILFEVVVGREPDIQTLPVRRKQRSRVVAAQRIQVDTVGPTWLVIRPGKQDGVTEIVLQIGPGHFETSDAFIDPMSPVTVVRFLGTVLPRMVMREAKRLKKNAAPIWIVTGRTALWPPLYTAIEAVAGSVPGSRMASSRPFPPSEMKVAVINGALALAANPHLTLGNDVLNPLAVVSIAADAQITDSRWIMSGRRVTRLASIKYLSDSDQPTGTAKVSCTGRCELVRAIPGLSEPDGQGRPDKEALDMFDAFAIQVFERLVSDIAQTGSTERLDLSVSWNTGDRSTEVAIDAGSGREPQRFEVPNREVRIYHD